MASLLWSPLPVLALTIRQFSGGKAVRVVAALAMIPVLFSVVFAFTGDSANSQEFLFDDIYRFLFIATLLPILVLILATGALGNEIEDQTLPYLTLKPISRFRIIDEKLAATVLTATPLVMAGLLVSYLIIFRGDGFDDFNVTFLWAMLAATFGGVVAYGSLFLLLSLFINRALLAGIVYTLIWESLLGRYLPGLKLISVRHYTESIYVGIVGSEKHALVSHPEDRFDDPTELIVAIAVVIGICLVSILLSAWRLRNLNLE